MYRTDDRVRQRADGALEFLGRVVHQVKLRGFRIELGEIERVASECLGVSDVVVVVREDVPGDKRLVGYVVGDAEESSLRAELSRSLPGYMVPSALVRLERLPLNANGKVERKALPAPEYGAGSGAAYAAPETAEERALAELWQGLLGVERVGREDDFFALGGHSLLATRLVARVRSMS